MEVENDDDRRCEVDKLLNVDQSGEENEEEADYDDVLKDFVRVRAKPSVFFLLSGSLNENHLHELQKVLVGQYFNNVAEIDLVIHSFGGDPNVAFLVIELLRHHTEANKVKINACVPRLAKSAATLLCLGADKIVVHEIAELGPLDTQLYEKKIGGEGTMTSAITPFETLQQIKWFSLTALDDAVETFMDLSDLSFAECTELAIKFVKIMVDPLLTQIDPEKVGEYSRALRIGEEYGERLMKRYSSLDRDKQSKVIYKLVHGYPAHEYAIDFNELEVLGLNVELFENYEQDKAVENIHQLIRTNEGTIIRLIMPEEN